MQNLANTGKPRIQPIHIVMLSAFLLRIPYVFSTSYTHDELSALSRMDFSSFGDLMQNGIYNDYHPPLVQFFLIGWTSLFGDAEWIVKLPFALCGLVAVWVVYKTGKTFFNENAGLFTAIVLAVSQLFVFHSNVARPYAPGLLFSVLFLHSWLRLLVHRDARGKIKIYYVLFAFLAAATHYYAGITAGILGLSGLVLAKRSTVLGYVLTNAAVVVAMLPLLYIMQVQLSHGGLAGWLSKPESHYAWNFIFYTFHYSLIFFGAAVVLLLAGIVTGLRKRLPQKYSPHLVLVAAYIAVFLTGYIYSLRVSPILQFSVLQFGLPFLLLPVFSLLGGLGKKTVWLGSMALLATGIYSLYITRLHHQFLQNYPYASFAAFCNDARTKHPGKKILIVTLDRPNFVARYFHETPGVEVFSIYNKTQPCDTVLRKLQQVSPDMVIAGNCDFGTLSLLKSFYTCELNHAEGFANDFYLLGRARNNSFCITGKSLRNEITFGQTTVLDSLNQYHNILDTPLVKLSLNRHLQFVFTAQVQSASRNPLVLVMELQQQGMPNHWYGAELYAQPDTAGFQSTYATNDFHFNLRDFDADKVKVKMYLWNRNLNRVVIQNMKLGFAEPNYLQYGATEKF